MKILSMRSIVTRLIYLLIGGLLALLFLMLAQVSIDDLRLKIGNLRPVPDPTLRAGGLYSILPTGHIKGPHCDMPPETIQPYFRRQDSSVKISNLLGTSLPVISDWSSKLTLYLGMIDVNALPETGRPRSTAEWNGHTININAQTTQTTTSKVSKIVAKSYEYDPNCEPTIQQRARAGECIMVVFRITQIDNQKIGYELADEQRCIVPNTIDPIFVPRQPMRLTKLLSATKERLGLLDLHVVEVP